MPEERLVGLRNFGEVRDAVVAQLRRYRADTRPALGGGASGAERAEETAAATDDMAQQTLTALRAIRKQLVAIRELLEDRP